MDEEVKTQPNKFTPVLIAATIITIISSIPFVSLVNIFCCAGILAGGFFGTSYYNNKLRQTGNTAQFKDAAAIGILSGIISAMLVTMISVLIQLASSENPIPQMFRMFDSQGVTIPPQIEQFLQDVSDEYSKYGFSLRITIVTLIVDIIMFPLFSTVGGILSVALFNRKKTSEPE